MIAKNYDELGDSNLLTPKEAAVMLGLSVDTLCVWRSVARYNLKYVRCGRLIRYKMRDLREFIATRTQTHTAGGLGNVSE